MELNIKYYGIYTINYLHDIEVIQEILYLAIMLRALRHKDIYAISIHEKAYSITRDEGFIDFLRNNNLLTNRIIKL